MRLTIEGAFGVLFVALKLTGFIEWSWFLVLLPFYIEALLIGIFAFACYMWFKTTELFS